MSMTKRMLMSMAAGPKRSGETTKGKKAAVVEPAGYVTGESGTEGVAG